MKATRIIYKNGNRIRIEFPYNPEVVIKLKEIPDARWSKTLSSWHIPYTKDAFEKLKILFPNVEYGIKRQYNKVNEQAENLKSVLIPESTIVKSKQDVSVIVFGRRVAIKLRKNDADTRFILSLRYSRWDAKQFCWIVPNYPGNLDLIKDYFKDRITEFEICEDLEINSDLATERKIAKNELLLIKTKSGRLKVYFGFNKVITKIIKSMPYHHWNASNKFWSIPFSEKYLQEIKLIAIEERFHIIYKEDEMDKNRVRRISSMDKENYRRCPEEYILKLKELRYAESTVKTYTSHFEEFINYYNQIKIVEIDELKITAYLRYLVMERKVSTSFQNLAINAVKFYYEKVLRGERKLYLIDRPRKEKTLPNVLNEEEISNLFKCIDNIKHKCILMLAYSAGLRLGELINVKIKDIDPERKQIRIEQGKGKKDRYSLLSIRLLELLRKYYKEYKPTDYLFEGVSGGLYSVRSIQSIMKEAAKKAGIKKKVGVHTLRHTFATHLLENGTDLRYIQNLLGHESSKTTEIYTHITTRGFDQIKSPLDNLDIF